MDNNLGLTKFKHLKAFWCQKVLPLVYDESLSYYEVLCKLIHFINQLIDAINEMVDVLEEHDARITVLENWKNTLDQWKTEIETRITNIENGTTPIPLPIATATRLGGVKIGEGVTVQADGTISVEGGSSPYVLPTMDDDTKGGARLGDGLVITDTDKLDVDVDNLDLSNNESITSIQTDISEINENITNIEGDIQNIEGDVQALNTDVTNIISGETPVPSSYELPTMSSSTKGGAKLGDGLDITDDTLSVDSDNLDLSNNGTIQNIIDGTTEIDISNNETIQDIISGDTPVPSSYELPTMSSSTKGGAKVGEGLKVTNEVLSLADAIKDVVTKGGSIFGGVTYPDAPTKNYTISPFPKHEGAYMAVVIHTDDTPYYIEMVRQATSSSPYYDTEFKVYTYDINGNLIYESSTHFNLGTSKIASIGLNTYLTSSGNPQRIRMTILTTNGARFDSTAPICIGQSHFMYPKYAVGINIPFVADGVDPNPSENWVIPNPFNYTINNAIVTEWTLAKEGIAINTQGISTLAVNVGDLNDLTTSTKTSIVDAINELDARVRALEG